MLYRADPTQSLDALDAIDAVIADGRIYPKAQLDTWVELYRSHFHGWLYRNVTDALVEKLAARYDPPGRYDP